MMKHLISTLTLLAILPLPLLAQSPAFETVLNVPYTAGPDRDRDPYLAEMTVLDLHHPVGGEPVPVIIWFHGGGLKGGKKDIPEDLKNQGFVIVSPNYRLAPHVKAATAIEDAAAAIAWTLKSIEKYGGDPKRVFISGHSAGGYLTLMSVLDEKRLAPYGFDASHIAGLIPFSGHTITHFAIRDERGIPEEQPIIDEFAPLYHVRKDLPPILLITGDREREMIARHEENAFLYRLLKKIGHPDIELFELEGYGHGMVKPGIPLLLQFVKERS